MVGVFSKVVDSKERIMNAGLQSKMRLNREDQRECAKSTANDGKQMEMAGGKESAVIYTNKCDEFVTILTECQTQNMSKMFVTSCRIW